VLEADMDGQRFREQNVGGHAVYIPRIPSLRQPMLQGAVLRVRVSGSARLCWHRGRQRHSTEK